MLSRSSVARLISTCCGKSPTCRLVYVCDVTFTAGQLLSGLVELHLQELRCACRVVGSHLHVLRNVEVGNRIGHFGDGLAILAGEAQTEGDRLGATAHLLRSRELDFDVASHLFERRVAIAARA